MAPGLQHPRQLVAQPIAGAGFWRGLSERRSAPPWIAGEGEGCLREGSGGGDGARAVSKAIVRLRSALR